MTEWEVVGRLLLAAIFGAAVGIERQWHHKTAGLKTNCLVAIGAATFGLISTNGFGPGANPAQVAAGVVTGIGFIGGGVIIRHGGSVQGVNSAATLWATAGMGLALGVRFARLAWAMVFLVLLAQFTLRAAARAIDRRSGAVNAAVLYRLTVQCDESALDSVRAAWAEFSTATGVYLLSYKEARAGTATLEATVKLSEERVRELTALTQQLSETAGVKQAAWVQEEAEEGE